jgi:DNA-binding NarL/FixJ family response regulator
LANPAKPPILVVDDDARFRCSVAEVLESIGYRTEQRDRGMAVLPAASAERPAAVILEVELPGLNGYEVCRQLRDLWGEELPILLVSSTRTAALDRAAGLLLGADDYLTKPVDPAELIARIRRFVEPPQLRAQAGASNGKLDTLTQREREILDLLGEGYRQEEIAIQLVISPKTVATHIQRILVKLDVRSRTQAVALVLRDEKDVVGHVAV